MVTYRGHLLRSGITDFWNWQILRHPHKAVLDVFLFQLDEFSDGDLGRNVLPIFVRLTDTDCSMCKISIC